MVDHYNNINMGSRVREIRRLKNLLFFQEPIIFLLVLTIILNASRLGVGKLRPAGPFYTNRGHLQKIYELLVNQAEDLF